MPVNEDGGWSVVGGPAKYAVSRRHASGAPEHEIFAAPSFEQPAEQGKWPAVSMTELLSTQQSQRLSLLLQQYRSLK